LLNDLRSDLEVTIYIIILGKINWLRQWEEPNQHTM
jgi:hypothetical protein